MNQNKDNLKIEDDQKKWKRPEIDEPWGEDDLKNEDTQNNHDIKMKTTPIMRTISKIKMTRKLKQL